MGVASYLERVLLVMDTPEYRVLQFEQLTMTLLYRDMVFWLCVLAAAKSVLRLSYKQARALI